MIRYTTPTYALTVAADLTAADDVIVTMRQGTVLVEVDDAAMALDNGKTVLTYSLTQAQSASFKEGCADVQVNWMQDGQRNATVIKQLPVGRQLHEQVME